jgi:hypothetical protein
VQHRGMRGREGAQGARGRRCSLTRQGRRSYGGAQWLGGDGETQAERGRALAVQEPEGRARSSPQTRKASSVEGRTACRQRR